MQWSRMCTWVFGRTVVASLLLLSPAHGRTRPSLKVLVEDYAQVPAAVLSAAEREAGRILGQAGLQTDWIECPVTQGKTGPGDLCSDPAEG